MQPQPRPFPALSTTERLHLEVYGYVVIERAIDADLVRRLVAKTYELEEHFRREGVLPSGVKSLTQTARECFRLDNVAHVAPCYLEYLTHPRLVAIAEKAKHGLNNPMFTFAARRRTRLSKTTNFIAARTRR